MLVAYQDWRGRKGRQVPVAADSARREKVKVKA